MKRKLIIGAILSIIAIVSIVVMLFLFPKLPDQAPPIYNPGLIEDEVEVEKEVPKIIDSEKPPYKDYCEVKNDCVASSCCHPSSSVNEYYAPDCSKTGCTGVCGGPLDCGAGFIDCRDNRCVIVSKEGIIENKTEECSRVGGSWTYFPDGCGDSCYSVRADEPVMCTLAFQWGCECGVNSCWNGETCESN